MPKKKSRPAAKAKPQASLRGRGKKNQALTTTTKFSVSKQAVTKLSLVKEPARFSPKRWLFKWALLIVCAAAVWWRFSLLASLPAGLNRDEAALAYNGLLLAQTGHDEWQRAWPVTLESFGDYKLPGYPYLLALLWQVFPVNDLVVRFPSSLAGVLLVLVGAGITWQLSRRYGASLLAAALLAANPIFIWYSRGAWEANLSLLCFALAVWLVVWRARHQRWCPWGLLGLFVLLLLSFFTYNTPYLASLCLLPFIPWFFWRAGAKFYLPLLGIMVLALGCASALLLPVWGQKTGITIFSDDTIYHQYITYRESLAPNLRPLIGRQELYWTGIALAHLGQTLWPQFLLGGGGHPWHQLPGDGHFHLLTVVLIYWTLAGGIWLTWRTLRPGRVRLFFTSPGIKGTIALLCCLLPSLVTVDAPHATRSLLFFAGLMIATGCFLGSWRTLVGKVFVWQSNAMSGSTVLAGVLTVILLFAGARYFRHYQQVLSSTNLYMAGLERVLSPTDELTLVIADQRPYQYINLAWASKMPATEFWQTLVRENPDPAGIKGVSDLGNYHFFDHGVEPWPNWRIVEYETASQQWVVK